ncbi:MAG: hypothetical protein ABI884_09465 [Gemmatimonadota bacterium]
MRTSLLIAATALLSFVGSTDRVSAAVTVVGGGHDGVYLLENDDTPCAITSEPPPRPKHQFDVLIGAETRGRDPKKLTLLMLMIPDADLREDNHSFFSSITFGDIGSGNRYSVETRPDSTVTGSGTVSVRRRGHDATVGFDVTSPSGIEFKGTIQCVDVARY